MYNRSLAVDENFLKFVKEGRFPQSDIRLTPQDVGLSNVHLIDLFETQLISRLLDLEARALKEKNQSFYTIGSSGHEGNAAVALAFDLKDLAFLHYRDAAFFIQRAKQLAGSTPIYDMLLSFVASSEDPISGGRHKVLGSVNLNIPPQTSTIASHLPKAVGAAIGIDLRRRLNHNLKNKDVVICSFGDASLNHSTAQGAINTAQWIAYRKLNVPIVFVCEDNGLGISVKTPPDWVGRSIKDRPMIKYIYGDGLHILDAYRASLEAALICRKVEKPVFLHLRTVRMMGHAGSDMETEYATIEDIEANEFDDPLLHTSRIIRELDVMSSDEIIGLYNRLKERIASVAIRVSSRPKLETAEEVMASIIPKAIKHPVKFVNHNYDRETVFTKRVFDRLDRKKHMAQLINFALKDILISYPNTVIFGEDVAKKGGVYHVTTGILEAFGGKRIFNTLLDEQAVLGTAIGMAQQGFVPIPEIQFLAYLHNAEDQLRGEAATLSFFSNGQLSNPMVIRIAGLAYQKGFGGHFHNDNSIAIFRDLPGVILACPSNGADAVRMLRTCVRMAEEERRVIVFLEPIALYMTKDLHEKDDESWSFPYPELAEEAEYGEPHIEGDGQDLTIISYANGYYLSRQAAKVLEEKHQIRTKIVDLRWLAPLNKEAIVTIAKQSKRILIVDECRKSASLSEEIITILVENLKKIPTLKRITGDDTFIPLGNAWQYVLPDKERIIAAAREMCK